MITQFVPENALSVGIDPHRDTLEVVAIRFPEAILIDEEFENTASGHRALLERAREVASKHDLRLTFGIEDSGNYGYNLARYLVEQGCEVKGVNPLKVDRQRDFYGQDKTDHLDALTTAAVVLRAYHRLPDVKPVREAVQATQELSRYHEQLVKEQTAALNRLHNLLANQYPAYKSFFNPIKGTTALAFWQTYPTPNHLEDVSIEELAGFFYEKSNHRINRQASREKAQHILDSCEQVLSSNQRLLIETQARIIQDLARRLAQLKRSIEDVKAQLEMTISATGQQLETLNGLGIVLAGVMIGDTLSTKRFDNDPNKYASYNGTAPVVKGSGQYSYHVENKRCNRRLKNAFHQLAVTAARHEPLSKAYYERLVEEKGMESNHALKRLMRRLSDIVFAMMRDKTPYDLDIHRRKQAEGGKKKGESVAAAKQRQEPSTFPSPRDDTISRPRERVKQREAELSPV
ncbi:MAG: IS110 family transposase [Anaerolineae bacterium]|jgi:transposase